MHLRITSVFTLSVFMTSISANDNVSLEETYTVTARPIGLQSIEHVAQPITVLRGEELKKRQDSSIGETLSNIPGVTTNRYSPLASRPIIRGFDGPRVQILENGMGSYDVSTISVDHAVSIDPIQAEQIEIFRGPSTLLYGSEASGGLVNVVTNRIPDYVPENFDQEVYSSYNSNSNETLLSWKADGGFEKMAFHFDAMNRDANDYEAANGRVINSYYDSTNLNFGSSWVDSWGSFGFSYGRLDSTYGIPLNPDEPNELKFLDLEQDRLGFSGQINKPHALIRSASLQLSYNDYQHIEFEDAVTPGTTFNNEQLEGRIELQHMPLGRFNGTFGSQFGYRDVSAFGDEAFIPKTNREHFALFILEETDISDNLHFEVGARYEYQDHETTNNQQVDHDMFSVSSGIHWHFTQDIALALMLGRSQRGPAAEELFSNGPHEATGTFEIGQSDLDVETVNSIDLGLSREMGRWQWSVNLFANYIEDFIFLQGLDRNNDGVVDEVDDDGTSPGELLLVEYQQDDAIFYGFEVETGINLYSGTEGLVDLRLFGDYVRAQRTSGENLPRISPARIGAGLNYVGDKLSAGIDWTQILAQNDNGSLETDTDGYSLLNLNANYALFEGENSLSVFARANNLLDEDGRMHTSFIKDRAPIMGRALTVGFDAAF